MINGFSLYNVATYKNKIEITGLKKLNFFYGTNGCGKTTISRLLADPTDERFLQSSVNNPYGYKCYVYNQDFIEKNFYLNDHLNGIFTLGDDAKEAEIQIARIKKEVEVITKDIDEKKKLFDEKSPQCLVKELKSEKEKVIDRAWDFKKKIEEKSDLIRKLLTGFNNSKDAFFNELLRRTPQTSSEVINLDDLIQKASIIYSEEQNLKNEVAIIPVEDLMVFSPLSELSEVIVNSASNNQISELIARISHLAWFEKGIEYLKINNNNCPFCNKEIQDELMLQINRSIRPLS